MRHDVTGIAVENLLVAERAFALHAVRLLFGGSVFGRSAGLDAVREAQVVCGAGLEHLYVVVADVEVVVDVGSIALVDAELIIVGLGFGESSCEGEEGEEEGKGGDRMHSLD